jgi:aspartyl-tRNA synthetase
MVSVAEGKVSKQMVNWVAGLQDESIVLVEGIVKTPLQIIKSATVGNVEIHIDQVCEIN